MQQPKEEKLRTARSDILQSKNLLNDLDEILKELMGGTEEKDKSAEILDAIQDCLDRTPDAYLRPRLERFVETLKGYGTVRNAVSSALCILATTE